MKVLIVDDELFMENKARQASACRAFGDVSYLNDVKNNVGNQRIFNIFRIFAAKAIII